MRVLGILALGLVFSARAAGAATPEATIDFLFVAADVESSAGGHAGIRFGADVYHFQNDGRGLLQLERDADEHFRWVYGVLENRSIEVARVAVSADTYALLRDRFNERYLLDQKRRAVEDALARDRVLLEWLVKERTSEEGRAPSSHGRGVIRRAAPRANGGVHRRCAVTLRASDSAWAPASCGTGTEAGCGLVLRGAGLFDLAPPGSASAGLRRVEISSDEDARGARRDPTEAPRCPRSSQALPSPPGPGTAAENPALVRLRERIHQRYGQRFAAARAAEARARLRDLAPDDLGGCAGDLAPGRYPDCRAELFTRYEALALELVALDVLERALPPAAGVLVGRELDADGELALTAEERRRLRDFAARLEESLVALAGSGRPDWGLALLVGMARLAAVRESLAVGSLIVPSTFRSGAELVPAAAVQERAAFFGELEADARARLRAARASTTDALDERDWSRLEARANRFLELWHGLRGRPVRVQPGGMIPARAAAVCGLPLPERDRDELVQALDAVRAADRAYARALGAAFGYRLRTRNCVTEVFATIDAALGRDQSVARLGGYVDPGGPLRFIPWVASHAVVDGYDVVAVSQIPSFRRARVREMAARAWPLAVYLREANTLTSTLYRPNRTDSAFLFFTDDAVLPRPLSGLANVAAGLAQTALGVLASPLDGGRTLWSGVKGVAFSVPELFLVNIRKGSFEYGPGHAPTASTRPLDGEASAPDAGEAGDDGVTRPVR